MRTIAECDSDEEIPRKPPAWAHIRQGGAKRRSAVNSHQATLFAHLSQRLQRAMLRELGAEGPERLPADKELEILDLDEYRLWTDGAFACGFVMDNGKPDGNLDAVNRDPEGTVGRMPFPELRQYVHYLQRSEKWADCYASPVYHAIRSGALQIVAERLLSDDSLYEPVG